ncbi:2-methylaconitate cis-trans isomerase PrpF family protein [Bacillus velezensis]|uniref:2-methylaconitate cis-trans isomerase PrpF family protein n=1 Tax=Bacillus velezensis TaxID=492670 RepID=UPI0012EAAFDA|nr:PrpF domain-containing protein [Bacillus velezensis]WFO86837.1 3-methylitaconate isomerase [Bacillus velezensis]
MEKVPVTVMRGGTSKGVFIHEKDMPDDTNLWSDFLLDIMGSPDERQIDGLGGGHSLTSKAAIIKKSARKDADVEYTFAQVSLTDKFTDFKGNCGNISSAVGPYAIEKGLVQAEEPVTKVRILNTNTQKVIVAEVEVRNGTFHYQGDCSIPGVPGTASPIYLSFHQAEGAVTGKLFPTGQPIDVLDTPYGNISVSIIDYANPLVFVKAEDTGLTGLELPDEYTPDILEKLEMIRSIAAEKCRFAPRHEAAAKSPAVPKLTLISSPADYIDTKGIKRHAEEMDLVIRMMSMQKPHQALAITGAVCTTAGMLLQDTILSEFSFSGRTIRLGHPSGILKTEADVDPDGTTIKVVRTARKISEGYVFTKQSYNMNTLNHIG